MLKKDLWNDYRKSMIVFTLISLITAFGGIVALGIYALELLVDNLGWEKSHPFLFITPFF